jgi:hypothetical protein
LDPGWKKSGSGINIPDPQHCILKSLIYEPSICGCLSRVQYVEDKNEDRFALRKLHGLLVLNRIKFKKLTIKNISNDKIIF